MRILFTGSSSFSGYWFIKELAAAGHEVTATFRSDYKDYTGVRQQRVDLLLGICKPIFACPFGSSLFVDVIKSQGPWDLFCHHAADVANYRSPDFTIGEAIENNTRNLKQVLDSLESRTCKKVVITGSVFEQNEGAGSDCSRAFSPYGLSKGFTAEIFRFHAEQRGLKLGKFVIPNPFGPYEDFRYTSYLVQNWVEGKTPSVNTPSYVRDNIHVSLLARAYRFFIENLSSDSPRFEKFNPSGYVESQGDFTLRFARELGARLPFSCDVDLKTQTEFPEPQIRINTNVAAALPLGWDEKNAWNELASYYASAFNLHAGVSK